MHKLNRPIELNELTIARNAYTGTISQDEAWKNFGNNGDRTKVREQLEDIQNDLCAYCENSLENNGHIDHFNPKSSHWRLVFDWDNLVVSCSHSSSCGGKKDKRFEAYWINPYVVDPQEMFTFYSDGQINGNSADAKNIIKDFGLDCARLEQKRKGVLSSLRQVILTLESEPEALNYFLEEELNIFPTASKQVIDKLIGE